MWETVLYILGGIAIVIVFGFLVVSVIRDYKMSKEWERLFKKGGRDD